MRLASSRFRCRRRLLRREAGARGARRHLHRARRAPGRDSRARLRIRSPALGDFIVHAQAGRRHRQRRRGRPRHRGGQGLSTIATALPLIPPMLGPDDGRPDAAERRRQRRRGGGSRRRGAPSSAARPTSPPRSRRPGVIEQTGTHRRIVFGEVFGALPRMSDRVRAHPRGAGRRRHPGGGGRRRPRADLGEVHLPRRARRLHRRDAAADRTGLGRSRSSARSSSTACREVERWRAPKACRSRRTHRADRDLRRRHSRDDAVVAADRPGAGEEDRGRGAAGLGRPPRRRGGRAGADHVDAVCACSSRLRQGRPDPLEIAS